MKKNKIKVVVCGHDQKFWKPIQRVLERSGLYEFREDYWSGHNEHDPEHSRQCIDWANVIIAEWTLGNAVWYSRHKKIHQKLITRLHLQERNTPFPGQLKIENVDEIVFVGGHIQDEVVEKFNFPRHKTCVISNFVDFKKYAQPKNSGCAFNLGIIGVVPMRKRLDLAMELLGKLIRTDPRYCLHIKGPNPDSYGWLWARTAEREYYMDLWSCIKSTSFANRVIFHPAGDDVAEWFRNIAFILSPSNFESFHMVVAEGMCSGTIPVVWNWEGSDDIYRLLPPVSGVEDAAELILKINQSETGRAMAQQAQAYVQRNFDVDIVFRKWSDLLAAQPPASEEDFLARQGPRHVLVFWLIANWESYHRREMIEALARNLEGRVEVLVVEPGRNANELIRRGWETRESLEQYAENKPQRVGGNIHKARIVTGRLRLIIDKFMHFHKMERRSSGHRLNDVVHGFYGEDAKILHWIYKPNQTDRLARGKDDRYVYEVYDDYTRDFATGKIIEAVKEQEEKICRNAQHVFFTAETLEQRKRDLCNHFSTISNGVNYQVFESYRVEESAPDDAGLRKSVGYLGNMSDFFDWGLVLHFTRALPQIDFYFHGNIEHRKLGHTQTLIEELQALPNTVFTGLVTREQGAAAIARYNALIIPFVVNEAMNAVNPLKLWEYFAAGKPVICSRIKAIECYSDIVDFPTSANEWAACILRAVNALSDKADIDTRINLARRMSWTELTKMHAKVIKRLISG